MIKPIIGYATGVFDLFHVGHLNILKKAKENCDYLVVGVTTDEEAMRVKNKKPIIVYKERAAIIRGIKYVDKVVPEDDTNKIKAWQDIKFDRMFKGDDWKGTPKFKEYKKFFDENNVEIIFFKYTDGISSTELRKELNKQSN